MKKFIIFGVLLFCLLLACALVTCEKEDKAEEKEPAVMTQENSKSDLIEEDIIEHIEATSAPAEESSTINKQVNEKVGACFSDIEGTCQWGIYDFNSDITYANASSKVPSASVIKVFIMEYAFHRVHNVGDLSLTTTFEGTELKTLVKNMITVSDNASTNVLINAFGMDTLNDYFSEQGYTQTRLERRMLDYDAMAAGKENYTSVNDSLAILKKIYNKQDNEMYKDMLYYLKQQTRRGKIPANIPDGVVVANKTGELDTVENDIGLIFSEETDFAAVFLCSELSNRSAAVSAISKAARSAYDVLSSTEN